MERRRREEGDLEDNSVYDRENPQKEAVDGNQFEKKSTGGIKKKKREEKS